MGWDGRRGAFDVGFTSTALTSRVKNGFIFLFCYFFLPVSARSPLKCHADGQLAADAVDL